MKHPECAKWQQRSNQVLGGGPATLSKHPSRYPVPLAPSVLARGDGPYVWCPDGEKYVDMVAGLGPVILGHNNPAVSLAVMNQTDMLACSTMGTPLECEVAEMLCALIPGAEHVRFACNGKDVTEAAIKLARYVTGHRHVVYCGYSGGFSDYLSTTDKDGGILPELKQWNHQVSLRDWAALERVLYGAEHDVAAIILEVPPEAPEVTREDTAACIRRYAESAHAYGGLFILDEIVTGLRYGLQGAQGYYGVQADLITMSKALGNGYPIAAIMGPRDLMESFEGGKVFLSTTFGSSPIGLAAAKATLTELQSKTHGWCRLQEWGEVFLAQLQGAFDFFKAPCTVRGNFARMVIDWHDVPGIATSAQLQTLWLQETAKRGLLFGVPIFPMTCWDACVGKDIIVSIYETMDIVSVDSPGEIEMLLEVPVIQSVFQRYEPQKGDA